MPVTAASSAASDLDQAIAQCQAALTSLDATGVLPALQAAQVQPEQRPALTCQLLLLRLFRAEVPVGDSMSEAQLGDALRPLKPFVVRGGAGSLTPRGCGGELALFRASTLSKLWAESGRGRVHLLLEALCPVPAAASALAASATSVPSVASSSSPSALTSRVTAGTAAGIANASAVAAVGGGGHAHSARAG